MAEGMEINILQFNNANAKSKEIVQGKKNELEEMAYQMATDWNNFRTGATFKDYLTRLQYREATLALGFGEQGNSDDDEIIRREDYQNKRGEWRFAWIKNHLFQAPSSTPPPPPPPKPPPSSTPSSTPPPPRPDRTSTFVEALEFFFQNPAQKGESRSVFQTPPSGRNGCV